MKKIVTMVMVILLIFTNTTVAHQAIFIKNPIDTIDESFKLTNIEESQAIYSQLKKDNDVNIFRFSGKAGQQFYTQLMVPNIDGNRELLLNLVITGPFTEANYLEQYTPVFGRSLRGYVIAPGNNRKRFFEPFTQTSYLKKQQFSIELPADGTYYILVYSPVGQRGKYVIAVGEKEKFGVRDLLQYPTTWFRVNYWFNPLRPFTILLLVGLVVFTITKIILRKRKKRRF